MTSLEQVCFAASVAMSRMHFTNANLVCTPKWFKCLQLLQLDSLFTHVSILPTDPSTEYNLPVFWSTAAKKIGLVWARARAGNGSVLLMDADAIIWNPAKIAWDDSRVKFVGGYEEPLHWEAYREQRLRLGDLFKWAVGKYTPTMTHNDPDAIWTCNPVNGSCLYFNDSDLLNAYIECLEHFMVGFRDKKLEPRGFLADKNDPQSAVSYFSEVMMADQRILGVLLQSKFGDSYLSGEQPPVAFLNEFPTTSEYPAPSYDFLHLWKYKAVADRDPTQSVLMEQEILKLLYEATCGHPLFLHDIGIHLVAQTQPMIHHGKYMEWLRC